jgi:hypothetical protein
MMYEVPENWLELTEEEQEAWVKAALIEMREQPDN